MVSKSKPEQVVTLDGILYKYMFPNPNTNIYMYIYIYYMMRVCVCVFLNGVPWYHVHSGIGSHDQRVSELKGLLQPSPASRVPWFDTIMTQKFSNPHMLEKTQRPLAMRMSMEVLVNVVGPYC